MRWLLPLLLLVPLAGAQQSVLSEPAGDVQGTLATGESSDVPAGRGLLDLRSLTVLEGSDVLLVALQVESYGEAEQADMAAFLIGFRYDTSEFGIRANVFAPVA